MSSEAIFIKRKLLLFDLDGTLLTSDKTISPETVQAIKNCSNSGIVIGYITARARPFYNERFFIDDLPCDFIAYYNGASMYAGGELIENNVIPFDNAMKIINEINKNYKMAIKQIGIYHEPWSYKNGENWNIETGEKIKCELSELPRHDVQRIRFVFECENYTLDDYMTEDTAYFKTSDGTSFIVNKNAKKENALIKAADYYNIPLSEVIAFGDDITDFEMLEIAGTGIAMGNAIDSVKTVANYVTDSNDNDGISKWIYKFLLKVE